MPEITQQLVERVRRYVAGESFHMVYDRPHIDSMIEAFRADLSSILARLATPELVALGEAAVKWDAAERDYLRGSYTREKERVFDQVEHEFNNAARLYAQSIKGEDHGK